MYFIYIKGRIALRNNKKKGRMVKIFKCAKHISTFDFSFPLRNKDLFPKRIR